MRVLPILVVTLSVLAGPLQQVLADQQSTAKDVSIIVVSRFPNGLEIGNVKVTFSDGHTEVLTHTGDCSFAMVGGICFLLLVSLTLESVLKAFSHYVQSVLPGGIILAMAVYLIFDLAVIILLFAIMFKYLPNAKIHWRDVWIGAVMTSFLFVGGKWALGLYLGSGTAGSAYGAASSLITLLLWIYYSSQILLFGAEFTQVYATHAGRRVEPDQYAIRIETKEVERSGSDSRD
jgi:membrane protein